MKKQFLYVLTGVVGACALWACSDDFNSGGSSKGKIQPLVKLDTKVDDAIPTDSRATADAIAASDLGLRLVPSDASKAPSSWASVTEFNNNEEFPVGDYTLEAFYGDLEEEGFNKPYYYGSALLTVKENQVSEVSLNVALANSMVSITTTEAFDGYFTSSSFAIASAGSASEVAYPAGSGKAAYMKPGQINIYAEVVKPNGVGGRIQAAAFTAEACKHYTVNVDVNNGNVGLPTLEVSFTDELDAVETIEIELSDELFAVPAPIINVKGYDSTASYGFIAGDVPAGLAPELTLQAPGSFQSIMMTSKSAWLEAQGIPAELDLLTMSDATYAKLKELGMTGAYHRVDKLAMISLTEMLKNIKHINDADDNSFSVAFIATDKNGRKSEPVVISIEEIGRLQASVSAVGALRKNASEMDIEVSYNGTDIENDIAVQYKNERGTWSNATYTVLSSRAINKIYTLHLTGLRTDGDQVELRLTLGGTKVEDVTAVRDDLDLTAAENDIFATYATVTLSSGSIDLTGQPVFTVTAGDGAVNAKAERIGTTNSYKLTGLTPGTVNTVVADYQGVSAIARVNTEAAAQIPNSDMEEWSTLDSDSHWELLCPGASEAASVWGTNNPMTTSQGSNYAYCRISGTISTSVASSNESNSDASAHSGSNAALIRTIGWGSGNTATGSGGNSGKTKYIDAGLLHLGSSRSVRPDGVSGCEGTLETSDLNCGLDFASRPASFSFWYRYVAKNSSDKGQAEIRVLDASGNILASGIIDLAPASSYTQQTISLSYGANCAKAAKIYVKFLSTNSTSFLSKSNDNLTGPGFANLSRGKFQGSQLYIDDISLNY